MYCLFCDVPCIVCVCKCVLNNCHQVATQLQLNISYIIYIYIYIYISYNLVPKLRMRGAKPLLLIHGAMKLAVENRTTGNRACPKVSFSITDPTWIEPGPPQ